MKRTAQANWKGTGLEGKGTLSTQSGVFDQQPFSFLTRFKNEDGKLGTNPEELIAAAHAGCFNMALSFKLNAAGFTATELNTTATVRMNTEGSDFKIDLITLNLIADIPEITPEQFQDISLDAKNNCPISGALSSVTMKLIAELK